MSVDILSVITGLHVFYEYIRSFGDISPGSHEHSLDVGLHGFDDYKHFTGIPFRPLRYKEIFHRHELASVIRHESRVFQERIILGNLIDKLNRSLRRLLDIFDVRGTDGHIVFVVDISGIVRYRKISRIFLEFRIRKWVVAEVVDDAFYL